MTPEDLRLIYEVLSAATLLIVVTYKILSVINKRFDRMDLKIDQLDEKIKSIENSIRITHITMNIIQEQIEDIYGYTTVVEEDLSQVEDRIFLLEHKPGEAKTTSSPIAVHSKPERRRIIRRARRPRQKNITTA